MVLASITFQGIVPGSYPLEFLSSETFFVVETNDPNPGDFAEVTVDLVNGGINVNAIPIPSTIVLLGGGLIGLAALRRRRD